MCYDYTGTLQCGQDPTISSEITIQDGLLIATDYTTAGGAFDYPDFTGTCSDDDVTWNFKVSRNTTDLYNSEAKDDSDYPGCHAMIYGILQFISDDEFQTTVTATSGACNTGGIVGEVNQWRRTAGP
jgi:hypothetical protein